MRFFERLRILDLTHVWIGPVVPRILADLGAEVIKVEHAAHPDSTRAGFVTDNDTSGDYWNHSLYFTKRNVGKRGIQLDLAAPEGKALFLRLVGEADAVVENFTPGVMDRLGLDYASLREQRPDLVMVSLSGYGQTGPNARRAAYGMSIEPASGVSAVTGYPGDGPMKTGQTWIDHYGGLQGAGALIAALLHRARSGEGQYVEVSMQEAAIPLLAWHVADYQLNGRLHGPDGARRPGMVRGSYPCAGDDDWLAVSIHDEAQWRAFCLVAGRPGWLEDARFADMASRYDHHDALDGLIAEWTRGQSKFEAAQRLQEAGVPAAPVLKADEILADEQLAARGFFDPVEIPGFGVVPIERYFAPQLDGEGVGARGRAPRLGEHTDEVLAELLGLDADELADLAERGITSGAPERWMLPATREIARIPFDRYQEQGSILRVDRDFRERLDRQVDALRDGEERR